MLYPLIQIASIIAFAALCALTPPYISYLLLTLLFVRVFFFLRPTNGQKIHPIDFSFCFLLMGGRLLQGTAGTSLCEGLNKSGDTAFVKHQQDAFTSRQFTAYLNENHIGSIVLAGVDAASCVCKTAIGAANRGYRVTVLQNGILGKRVKTTNRALQKLSAKGVECVGAQLL